MKPHLNPCLPSRRSALKLMLAAAGAVTVGMFEALTFAADDYVDVTHIPPTVMFHARDAQRRILPHVIDTLLDDGYTFVTYKSWYRAMRTGARIDKPVIFTFDDITLTQRSPNFEFYSRVVDLLRERSVPAVFGVVTEPVVVGLTGTLVQVTTQEDACWQTAMEWCNAGIEFATHTQAHRNLDSTLLDMADVEREIVGSAALIAERTGRPVQTLITPYGSGVTHTGVISPLVLEACAAADISFVVGIAGMQRPVLNVSNDQKRIYAVGRIMPSSVFSGMELAGNLVRQVEQWDGGLHEYELAGERKRHQRPDTPLHNAEDVSGTL